jgi:pimeloyl-ACP methyl ester carboxylesterase
MSVATIVHKGITLAYEERGSGEPALVFVHGWACNRSFFAPQAEYFAQRHRVVSVDLRGHGESDRPEGEYPIAAYAGDIAYLIEQLGLGKVIAVGHSMGGIVVLQLAAAYPDLVDGIVMIEPVRSFTQPSDEGRARIAALAEAIEAGIQEPLRQYVTERFFLPTSDRKLLEQVLAVMTAAPSRVAANALRAIPEFDGAAAAARCKVPVLHIAATPPLNPPHLVAQLLPGAINGMTVGAGHFNQLEVPDQVNAMIEAFLRHHVGAGGA